MGWTREADVSPCVCSGCFVPHASKNLKNLAVVVQVVTLFQETSEEVVIRRKRGLCFLLMHFQQLRCSRLSMYDVPSQLKPLLLKVMSI